MRIPALIVTCIVLVCADGMNGAAVAQTPTALEPEQSARPDLVSLTGALAHLPASAATFAQASEEEGPEGLATISAPSVLIYEGWRQEYRFVASRSESTGLLRPSLEWNASAFRIERPPEGLTFEATMDHLSSQKEGLQWRYEGGSHVVILTEGMLVDNPAWPLNQPLGSWADEPHTLAEATAVLIDHHGLQGIGPQVIREPEAPSAVVWPPATNTPDPTVRNLLIAICRTVDLRDGWYAAYVHLPNFDPSQPAGHLEGVQEMPWVFQRVR